MHRFEHHWFYGPPRGDEFGGGPEMFFSGLSTLLMLMLLIGLGLALLKWIIPIIRPMLADIFGTPSTDRPALEILRQRYAAGAIDTDTFEQMRERLIASYQQESNGLPLNDYRYQGENWAGYRNTYTPPVFHREGNVRMVKQEHATPENDM